MGIHRDPKAGFDTRLRHITTAGVDLPAEVTELRARLKDFQRRDGGHAMRDRFADALIGADPEADIDLLWACALAEVAVTPALLAELRDAVHLRMHRAIRAAYAPHAVTIYESVAAKFDAAATRLTAAVAVVDVEAPAADLIDGTDKQRKAWKDAAVATAELNRLLVGLKAAAVLAEVCDDTADNLLPLTVHTGELHRRDIWAAWELDEHEAAAAKAARSDTAFTVPRDVTVSRTGRWGALLRLGAKVRACPPDSFAPYRRPKPMVERIVDGTRVLLDPESPDYQPPLPPKFAPPPARVVVTR